MSDPHPAGDILYIEDDPQHIAALESLLLPAGYRVQAEAGWHADLLARLRSAPPLALLLRHTPPLRDALRLLPQLRGAPPVLVVSRHDSAEAAVAALNAGAADYLVYQSPHFAPRLLATLDRLRAAADAPAQGALERRARHLAQVAVAGRQLAATHEPDDVLLAMLSAATSILGAQDASVWVWEDDARHSLVCQATSNLALLAALRQQRLRLGEGIAGWVVAHNQSTIVADVNADSRFQRAVDAQTGFQTRSILAVPLRALNAVIGVLEIVNKRDNQFDRDDMAVAELLAGSAAVALENARLLATLRVQAAELRARNEELDAFAHTVAHDLKSPLNWIAGFAELLHRDGVNLDAALRDDYIRSILNGAYMLGDIIDDLLLLASLRQPQAVLETIRMGEVVERVWQRIGPTAAQHGALLERPARFPAVRGYGAWIEGVWVNYITNAIQYGGQPPRVQLGYTLAADDSICFWVQDNGPGLSAAQQAHLFEPFSQPGTRHPRGHGLGLSIVRRIVEKLDGAVGVESAPGQGSRFWFTLPAADSDDAVG